MKLCINNMYIRKNTNDKTLYDVDYIKNGFIVFKNGARCKEETFKQQFIDVNDININENIMSEELNPDDFFKTSENDEMVRVAKQFVEAGGSNSSRAPMERPVEKPTVTSAHRPGETRDINKPTVQKAVIKGQQTVDGIKPPPEMMNNHIKQPIKPIDDLLDPNRGMASNNISNTQVIPVKTQPPEWDIFDRVKKKDYLILNIPFRIELPKAQKIDALDDMFESSFIEYLSDKYVKEFMPKHLDEIKNAIMDEIEKWVDDVVYKKKNKKKTRPIKTVIGEPKEENKTKPTVEDTKQDTKQEIKQESSTISNVNSNLDKDTKEEVNNSPEVLETIIPDSVEDSDITNTNDIEDVEIDDKDLELDENGNLIVK